ncbi:MAG: glycosyltransferase family 2 protein [Deltaproteobacteria bacterium]|nr:glycosyltransferase family 2 protein [Deltaproteobacteria bacterium]
MKDSTSYIIVTPVRDEEAHIGKTLETVAGQTIPPREWVIVDDGSNDQTGDIIDRFATRRPWIQTGHCPDRGFRKAGGGVIAAFSEGLRRITCQEWEYIVKLDGDLSLEPDYFERCLERFSRDPRLGIGGGKVYSVANGDLFDDSPGDPPFHVRGATKIYRRACWQQIQPLVPAPGWDTIDEVKANMLGWTTQTFGDIHLIQLKATGGADGNWRNWFKNGRANYITGYHPFFMFLKCLKRSVRKPPVLGAVALWAGFCSGYLRRVPQVPDPEVIRFLRQQQLRRLALRPSIYG